MFAVVKTAKQRKKFMKTYLEFVKEQGFQEEETTPDAIQYLLQGDGTLEVIPYNPEKFSTVEKDFKFSELLDIQCNRDTTWEVDKVGFPKESRGKGYHMSVIHCLMHHQKKYNFTRAVCLFEYRFYRKMSRIIPKEVLIPVSEKFTVEGEKLPIIAVVVDMEKARPWYDQLIINKQEIKI